MVGPARDRLLCQRILELQVAWQRETSPDGRDLDPSSYAPDARHAGSRVVITAG